MKRKLLILIVLLCGMGICGQAQAQRVKYTINESWKFLREDDKAASSECFDDSLWEVVSIPHTWNNLDAGDDEVPGYYRGAGWYRRPVIIDKALSGKQIYLYFEGANQVATLYINGQEVGTHTGGYTAFSFDITPYVKEGANMFAVRVDNAHNPDIPPLSADFTFFGGIYRDIYLIATAKSHISTTDRASSGVYITTPAVSKSEATVQIRTVVNNADAKPATLKIENVIKDPAGKEVSRMVSDLKLAPRQSQEVTQDQIKIANPQLWDTRTPNLYSVTTRVLDAKNKELDCVTNPLGLRWYSFDPAKGFFLNGQNIKLIGTSRHQDYYLKGNALQDEMHVRDVMLLKEMGGNFLRVSHYPQDPVVMQMCDKLGILTSVEIPVVNAITLSDAFGKNCVEMAREMVCQNFNSPSVVIWAYMNEVLLRPPYDRENKAEEQQYFDGLLKVATNIENELRRLDPARYTMLPCHASPDIYERSGIAALPKILSWNIYNGWYGGDFAGFDKMLDNLRQRFPAQSLIVAEYGADVDPRLHSFRPERFDYTAEYGNLYHEHYLPAIMTRDFVAGANIWNLNDFYSEARGNAVPHINSKGITGVDRAFKDTYWLYRARFNPSPMVRIGNETWKVRGGVAGADYTCVQPVKVYTNALDVELTLNGKSLGKRHAVQNIAEFDVPFVNGMNVLEAKAVTYAGQVSDVQRVDFRMVAARPKDEKLPFTEMNVMLGSRRYFEDRTAGMVWIPEQEYTAGGWGFVGGEAARLKSSYGSLPATDIDILGTGDDPVFQTQRSGIQAFRADVPDGVYAVYLYWAELLSDKKREALAYNLGGDAIHEGASRRVFDVSINGTRVIEGLNLAEQFGAERAAIRKFMVEVRAGQGLRVDFGKVSGEPVLNAIRIYRAY